MFRAFARHSEREIQPTLQRNTSLSRARLPIPPSGAFMDCKYNVSLFIFPTIF